MVAVVGEEKTFGGKFEIETKLETRVRECVCGIDTVCECVFVFVCVWVCVCERERERERERGREEEKTDNLSFLRIIFFWKRTRKKKKVLVLAKVQSARSDFKQRWSNTIFPVLDFPRFFKGAI